MDIPSVTKARSMVAHAFRSGGDTLDAQRILKLSKVHEAIQSALSSEPQLQSEERAFLAGMLLPGVND